VISQSTFGGPATKNPVVPAVSIGWKTDKRVVLPTVLPTVGRRGPGPGFYVGAIRVLRRSPTAYRRKYRKHNYLFESIAR